MMALLLDVVSKKKSCYFIQIHQNIQSKIFIFKDLYLNGLNSAIKIL